MDRIKASMGKIRNKVPDKPDTEASQILPAEASYSRIESSLPGRFPPQYFTLVIRPPRRMYLLHVPTTVRDSLRASLDAWVEDDKRVCDGIRKFTFREEPFPSEVNPTPAKLSNGYRLLGVLLETLQKQGCHVVSGGGGLGLPANDRCAWVMKQEISDNKPTSMQGTVATVGLEDWGKMFFWNCPSEVFSEMRKFAELSWPPGVQSAETVGDLQMLDLNGQPWDSYKTASERTPLLVTHLLSCMWRAGYRLVLGTHVRGVVDTLLFSTVGMVPVSEERPLMTLALCQQNLLRVYHAPSELIQSVRLLVREQWTKGIARDELLEPMWTLGLRGSPWWVQDWDTGTAVTSRLLIQRVLAHLFSLGWRLEASLTVYRSQYDKALLVLAQDNRASSDSWTTLGLTAHDINQLHVSGAPIPIHSFLEAQIQEHCPRPVRALADHSLGLMEFVIDGSKPWSPEKKHRKDGMEALGVMCWIVESLAHLPEKDEGYTLLTSADLVSSGRISPPTWIFAKRVKQHS